MKEEAYRFVICQTEQLMETINRLQEMGWRIVSQEYAGDYLWELTVTRPLS